MSAAALVPAVPGLALQSVTQENWRDVAALQVNDDQRRFVAEPSYYLAMCCYGGAWQPLAVCRGDSVVGMLLWAVDPADGSCWLGGILIDRAHQGRGLGRQAVGTAVTQLAQAHGFRDFALSYQPENTVARRLYASLGFVEGDEWEGDEMVARLALSALQDPPVGSVWP